MGPISPKVAAGFGGANLGAGLVIVLLYAIGAHPPQEVVGALTGIASAVLALAAGYVTPHSSPPVNAP